MSGAVNRLRIQPPPGTPEANNPLAPDWMRNIGSAAADWMRRQHTLSQQMGYEDPATGLPTSAGLKNALRQYTGALVGGSGAMKGKELPDALYHVVGPEWEPGQPLQSLYRQHKDAAYDIYSERWPDAGDLSQYHPHYTMFYDKLEDARQHPGEGRILKIDPAKVDLRFDQLEPPGYWITSEDVPPDAITVTPHKAGE